MTAPRSKRAPTGLKRRVQAGRKAKALREKAAAASPRPRSAPKKRSVSESERPAVRTERATPSKPSRNQSAAARERDLDAFFAGDAADETPHLPRAPRNLAKTSVAEPEALERRPPADLTGAQRAALRSQAHHLEPLVRVGVEGLTPDLAQAVLVALDAHELIKVKVLEGAPIDRREASAWLETACGAHAVGGVGRIVMLYRRHKSRPQVRLS